MKVFAKHYRIPESLEQTALKLVADQSRKRPTNNVLQRYSRQYGFANRLFQDEAPSVRGGATEVIIQDEDGNEYLGVSRCSLSDNFCYRIGREIAYGRALKELEGEVGRKYIQSFVVDLGTERNVNETVSTR